MCPADTLIPKRVADLISLHFTELVLSVFASLHRPCLRRVSVSVSIVFLSLNTIHTSPRVEVYYLQQHLGDDHTRVEYYICYDTLHPYRFNNGLIVIGFWIKYPAQGAWLAVNDSTSQPGSTPECFGKNHDTVHTTSKSRERGANRLRVVLGVSFTCTWSRYCLLLCSKIGSDPSSHTGVPSTQTESNMWERETTREYTVSAWPTRIEIHRDRPFRSHPN